MISQVAMGCATQYQAVIPAPPSATAPRQERVSYYNQYRPVRHEHRLEDGRFLYGPVPAYGSTSAALANGMEVSSLHDLETAIPQATELHRCAQSMDALYRNGTTAAVIFSAIGLGGAAVGFYGSFGGDLTVTIGGLSALTVGGIGALVAILVPRRTLNERMMRGLALYDPLLRQQLALEPEGVVPDRVIGGTRPCP